MIQILIKKNLIYKSTKSISDNIDITNFNTFVELNIENSENYQLDTEI